MNANDYAMAADRSGERRRLKPYTTVYIRLYYAALMLMLTNEMHTMNIQLQRISSNMLEL